MPTRRILEDVAREALRAKDYELARRNYLEVLQVMENHAVGEPATAPPDLQRVLNGLLVALFHLAEVPAQEQLFSQFESYMERYLAVTRELSVTERKQGAENIILDLFRFSLLMSLRRHGENSHQDQEVAKDQLVKAISGYFLRFTELFCEGDAFPRSLFIDKYLDVLYFERRNVLRPGSHRQNYRNTVWLAEAFLKLVTGHEYRRVRSDVMLLLGDVALFLPRQSPGRRFAGELESLEWLDRSLAEQPENPVARERRLQMVQFLTAAEQINRFRHDAVSKIESIRGILQRVQNKLNDPGIEQDMAVAQANIRFILGSFRLSSKEKPALRSMESMECFMERFKAADVMCSIVGQARPFMTDEDYLSLVLHNLIQNSREAYARIGAAPGLIQVVFDYDHLVLTVQDWAGGIPDGLRVHDKLFEPYASTKGIQQNAGLGLANVKESCELLQAQIRFEVLNHGERMGTLFTITLSEPERD